VNSPTDVDGSSLGVFDPSIASWFQEQYGQPTEVQTQAWSPIASGAHVLAIAPTGSGKTLAAFLWALDSLATGRLSCGRTRILYLSPLKALNADIARNLIAPLEAIKARFLTEGRPFPIIRVATRSGDTTQEERRHHAQHPPEILATTPETLAIMLNSPKGRAALSSVSAVVLDEIHYLQGEKRGTLLMASVERLTLLAGEFQRIALSATVADPQASALFSGGYLLDVGGGYRPRPFSIVRCLGERRLSLDIAYPAPLTRSAAEGDDAEEGESSASDPAENDAPTRWPALAAAFVEACEGARTTIIFVNSRRHAEKIAFLMNERAEREIAWAHHGSLSREVRYAVEERLKAGELPVVVATSSLELGIDIGSVDQVILAGTPFSVSSAFQRLGRSGHRVGAESRARIYPTNEADLFFAAALSRDLISSESRLEATRLPENPLDVLVQLVLSMTAMDPWSPDGLYSFLRRITSFRSLSRQDFDRVIELLRGRFDSGRLSVLSPRLAREETAGPDCLVARRGVLPLLYRSGGTIPDRGSYTLVLAGSGARLGELDEEFVWERRLGDRFALGSRSWRVVGIDDRAVTVTPAGAGIDIVPFWRAEGLWRDRITVDSILRLCDDVVDASRAGRLPALLRDSFPLDGDAYEALLGFLRRQLSLAGLPGRYRLLAEGFSSSFASSGAKLPSLFLHTLRGGKTNAPLAIALRSLADERWGRGSVDVFWDDAGILFSFGGADGEGDPLPGTPSVGGPDSVLPLLEELARTGLSGPLRGGLEETGAFGAAFREAAGRALLLPKGDFGSRTPLWLTRLRSKRLYETVHGYPDFPLVKEAWRTCLSDWFDLPSAEALLSDIASGLVVVDVVESSGPSPMARGSIWIAGDSFMYRRDEGSAPSSLGEEDLLTFFSEAEVHYYDPELASSLARRSKRLEVDYRPRGNDEFLDWLDERGSIPLSEWGEVLASANSEGPVSLAPPGLVRFPGAMEDFIVPSTFCGLDEDESERLFSLWFSVEGPVSEARVASCFGPNGVAMLHRRVEEGGAVRLRPLGPSNGTTIPGPSEVHYCEPSFAGRLLRAQTRKRRETMVVERPLAQLQLEAARRQRVGGQSERMETLDGKVESLRRALDPLLGVSFPGVAWERDILPARLAYDPRLLDMLASRFPLLWYGTGDGRIGFALDDELNLSDLHSVPSPKAGDESEETEGKVFDALSRLSYPPSSGGLADEPPRPVNVGTLASSLGIPLQDAQAALVRLADRGLARTEPLAGFRDFLSGLHPERKGRPPLAVQGDRPFGSYRPRRGFPSRSRWERERGHAEAWFPTRSRDLDLLEADRAGRERCRRLIDRFGVASRSVAALEERAQPWSATFKVLRLMELAGEVVGGRFYDGLDEIQFVYPEDLGFQRDPEGEDLQDPSSFPESYALCAKDPASLCGLGPLSATLNLPPRIASAHVVWRGAVPVLVSRRNGRALDLRIREEALLSSALDALVSLLMERSVAPLSSMVVETINDVDSRSSPWRGLLISRGFREDLKGLVKDRPL